MKNPQVTRYAAVKLRQRIAAELKGKSPLGWLRMYKAFAANGWIPTRAGGELLGAGGFNRQYIQVKRDLNHIVSLLAIKFLHRSVMSAYGSGVNYNGIRELARMTGLQEVTLKDILILEGEIL